MPRGNQRRPAKTVMEEPAAVSNVDTLNEEETEQISPNVSASAKIDSENSSCNVRCHVHRSDSSPSRAVVSEEKPRNSDGAQHVSGGNFLTGKAQDSQLSTDEVQKREGGKISSNLNTNELKSSESESRHIRPKRKVKKGFELYNVQRGKFSGKIRINENDYLLPKAGKNKGDLDKKPTMSTGKKMHAKGDKNHPPFTVNKTTGRNSSPFVKSSEDRDFDEPNLAVVTSENKSEDHVDNGMTNSQERHEISINSKLNKKPHQHNRKAKESSTFVSHRNREDPETKHGCSKLERPNGCDHNKPRGDAKFVKDNIGTLLERLKNIRIATTDSEIWGIIKSNCKNLQKLLSNDLTSLDDIKMILQLSMSLQDLYSDLIVKHLEFSFKNDVEGSLIKNTFHNIIKAFKNILNEPESCSFVQEAFEFYWIFLQDRDAYFQSLLELLQEDCKFNLDALVCNPLKMRDFKKQVD